MYPIKSAFFNARLTRDENMYSTTTPKVFRILKFTLFALSLVQSMANRVSCLQGGQKSTPSQQHLLLLPYTARRPTGRAVSLWEKSED